MEKSKLLSRARILFNIAFSMFLILPSAMLASSPVYAVTVAAESLPNFSELVEQSGPAVVNIRTTQIVDRNATSEEDDEFLKRFGVPNPHSKQSPDDKTPQQDNDEQIARGIGSGFILSSDGYVLTNAHVVLDADEVFVTLTDKREFIAKIIGTDVNTDVAVLKIEGSNLPKVTIGDSTKIKVGEWVIAIGSPFDLDNSITAGIISAKARELGDFLLLIQTDVAINPGNSGGPLINLRGEVIGINSQIFSRSGGYMGISFAIPIDDAIRVAEQLKTRGHVTRGRMGIYLADVSRDVARALNLPTATGALVSRVEKNSPAQKAGLIDGDIVLKFNETPIAKSTELRRIAAATEPGTKVNLTIWRKGAVKQWPIVLAELPQNPVVGKLDKKSGDEKSEKINNSLGLDVKSLTNEQKRELGITFGVLIEHAEGRAARAGLQPGDIILTINSKDVKDQHDFKDLVDKVNIENPVVLLARRENITQYIAINPRK